MASFVLSFFPLDVLDEIWDLIGSVSEGFPTCFYFSVFGFSEIGLFFIGTDNHPKVENSKCLIKLFKLMTLNRNRTVWLNSGRADKKSLRN